MTYPLPSRSRPLFADLFFALFLFSGAYFTYTAYTNFFDASWTFDDERVFTHLSTVSDTETALEFINDTKEVSQIGRPLSFASFLLNVADWPTNRAGFRRINALLHLLNGLILTLVALRVAREIPSLSKHATGFATFVSVAWLLHPFLASTSFHAIQRMTLLAATFSLLCFLTYIHGRSLLASHPYRGLSWMTFGLLVFGALGVFSKETAALTPFLIAVLEFTILNHYRPIYLRSFWWWRLIFFGTPIIVFLAYSIYLLVFSSQDHYYFRPFTLGERLLSETLILIEYVRQILLPDISIMGPYQDDTSRIFGLSLLTLGASLFWIVVGGSAVALRKRLPLYSFAVLFFLVGHLLESTYFGLELYFEHRNYLPSFGIIGALFAVAWTSSKQWPKIVTFLYTLLLAGLLWSVTTLWGHPILAPIAWAEAHPTSIRSAQVLTTMFWNLGQVDKAKETIANAYNRNPNDASLATNVLTYQCFDKETQSSKEFTENLIDRSPSLGYGRAIAAGLYATYQLMSEDQCDSLTPDQAIRFTQGFLENPVYRRRDQRKAFYLLISQFAALDENMSLSVAAKAKAFLITPWTNGMPSIYCQFVDLGNPDAALAFLLDAKRATQVDDTNRQGDTIDCRAWNKVGIEK